VPFLEGGLYLIIYYFIRATNDRNHSTRQWANSRLKKLFLNILAIDKEIAEITLYSKALYINIQVVPKHLKLLYHL
jgi:hypothetical protein